MFIGTYAKRISLAMTIFNNMKNQGSSRVQGMLLQTDYTGSDVRLILLVTHRVRIRSVPSVANSGTARDVSVIKG